MANIRSSTHGALMRACAMAAAISIVSTAPSPREALQQVSSKVGDFHTWDAAAVARYARLVGGFSSSAVSILEKHEVTGALFLELDEGTLLSWGVHAPDVKRFVTARQQLAEAAASETHNVKSSLMALRALNRRGFSLGLTLLQNAPHAGALYHGVLVPDNALRMFGNVDGSEPINFNWLLWVIIPEVFFIRHMLHFVDTDFFVSIALIATAVVNLLTRVAALKRGLRGIFWSFVQQTIGGLVTWCIYSILWPVIPFFVVDITFYVSIVFGLAIAGATIIKTGFGLRFLRAARARIHVD